MCFHGQNIYMYPICVFLDAVNIVQTCNLSLPPPHLSLALSLSPSLSLSLSLALSPISPSCYSNKNILVAPSLIFLTS